MTILSDAEQGALYGLPDFDDAQRLECLALAKQLDQTTTTINTEFAIA